MLDDFESIAFEQELLGLSGDPDPKLRGRILATVRRELRQTTRDRWAWSAAVAAALIVLWANLAWSVSRPTAPTIGQRATDAELAAQIHELLPELSPEEARRQASWLKRSAGLPNATGAQRTATFGVWHF